MTNEEKIKNMSESDFAEFMESMFRKGVNCANNTSCDICKCAWCKKHMTIKQWLKSEAD